MKSSLATVLTACLALTFTAHTCGQPLIGSADSIDLTVARANRVIVGRVADIVGGIRRDSADLVSVVMTVDDTLKGPPVQPLAVDLYATMQEVTTWRAGSHRLLVAVNATAGLHPTVIDLADEKLAVFTADFVLLKNAADVIQAARNALGATPAGGGSVQSAMLTVPPDLIKGTRWDGFMGMRLQVPADQRLERRASDILGGRGGPGTRAEAVNALRFFKSDENIQLLTALLSDPSWGYNRFAQENRGVEVRKYQIREIAYEILTNWGITVAKPITSEERFTPEVVTLIDLSDMMFRKTPVTDADVRELRQFENLTALVMRNGQLTDAAFKELGALTTLRELALSGSNLTDDAVQQLAALTSLETLDVSGTRITDAALKTIGGFSALKQLSVEHTRVTANGIADLERRRPEIRIDR